MAKSADRKVVLFKQETTQGVDPGPGPANGLRTLNYTPQFLDATQKVRQIDVPYFGAKPFLLAAVKRGATFQMEMSGAGTATTLPGWMLLNTMCGFAAGVAGSTSVTQSRTSTGVASFTHYAQYLDELDATKSLNIRAFGGRSSLGFSMVDDEFPTFNYSYLGSPLTQLASQSSYAGATYANQLPPVICSSQNTTITLDGFSLPIRSIEMSNNAQIDLRSLIGPQDYIAYINDSWSGTIVAEVNDLSAEDYFGKVLPGTMFAGTITHGTVAGNIVQISMPQILISGVSLSAEQGKLMMTLAVSLIPNLGNDDISFLTK